MLKSELLSLQSTKVCSQRRECNAALSSITARSQENYRIVNLKSTKDTLTVDVVHHQSPACVPSDAGWHFVFPVPVECFFTSKVNFLDVYQRSIQIILLWNQTSECISIKPILFILAVSHCPIQHSCYDRIYVSTSARVSGWFAWENWCKSRLRMIQEPCVVNKLATTMSSL